MRTECRWQQLTVKSTVALWYQCQSLCCLATLAADWTGTCQSNPPNQRLHLFFAAFDTDVGCNLRLALCAS